MSKKDLDETSNFLQDESLSSNNDELSSESDQRGTRNSAKIARRARSFKEDFLEKISQIRTPTNTISRSHSPKTKNTPNTPNKMESVKTSFDLNYHAKQVKSTLIHFKDVVSKNKLEMLHGNLTILLHDIANVKAALKAQKLADTSAIISATQQVYLNLGSLMKLCDEALLSENEENYISLNKETVEENIENIEKSVANLVNLATQRKIEGPKYLEAESDQQNSRSSLPDIPLTNREKQELETALLIHNSQSSESLLQVPGPPPKPVIDRNISAPPLPPKKKIPSIDESRSDAFMEQNFTSGMMRKDCDWTSTFDSSKQFIFRSHSVNSREVLRTFEARNKINFDDDSHEVFEEALSNSNVTEVDSAMSQMTLMNQGRFFEQNTILNNETTLSLSNFGESSPPPLPMKMRRSLKLEQHKSVYDNVDRSSSETAQFDQITASTTNSSNSSLSTLSTRTTGIVASEFQHAFVKDKYKSCIESSTCFSSDGEPPPLPLKKKHIMAYMQIFGNTSAPYRQQEPLVRHSMHSFSQSSKMECFIECQNDLTPKKPPALPPKKQKITNSNTSLNVTPPMSPNPVSTETVFQPESSIKEETRSIENEKPEPPVVLRKKPKEEVKTINLMEELDAQNQLIFRKDSDGASVLVGGSCDSLIIHATKSTTHKMSEAFAEAFLLTYRTFIEPCALIEKLIHRYTFFSQQNNDSKQKAAKEAFSLLVRVVNDLTSPDFVNQQILEKLVLFVYELVCGGELLMAKLLRVKIIEKTAHLRESNNVGPFFLPSRPIFSNPPSLIDLKSVDIAEQMTILDAELFHKIEVPEILIWAEQQNEEKSKNLTKFTEHFNKLSYWTRTQILKQQDAKDREKHLMKFIKIMKHLRKINNFNSYLALLSALDSAPIRRLEWQKHITEGLKEYCALIDSSSSFRAYRQALSETTPPCIPYIGLVLQDLTFVHIGNPDFLEDGSVNFSKRWQQSTLILNMKRFRTCSYSFKKNEKILGFFDNFDEYFDEDAMWQISEKIKPRGKKVTSQ